MLTTQKCKITVVAIIITALIFTGFNIDFNKDQVDEWKSVSNYNCGTENIGIELASINQQASVASTLVTLDDNCEGEYIHCGDGEWECYEHDYGGFDCCDLDGCDGNSDPQW